MSLSPFHRPFLNHLVIRYDALMGIRLQYHPQDAQKTPVSPQDKNKALVSLPGHIQGSSIIP